ncbi:flippase [candidate division KSB1 bacterium]|nr:flippase [candidate division KSB1 bacterium]
MSILASHSFSIAGSLLRNTGARSVAELTSRAGSAVFWVLVVRYLGQSALGSLAFGLSLFAMTLTLAKLGLGTVLIRSIADRPQVGSRLFGNGLLLGFVASIFAGGLMLIGAQMLAVQAETRIVVSILAAAMPFAAIFYWSQSLIWSAEKQGYIAIARFAENTAKIIFGLAVLLSGKGLIELAWVILISKIISCFVGLFFAWRIAPPDFHPDKTILRSFVGRIPVFAFISLFYDAFVSMAIVLITHLHGEAEAGLFGAAYKLLDILIFMTHAYSQALFPILARTKDNRQLLTTLLKKSIKYLWIFTLAAAAGAAVLAEPLIHLIYGSDLSAAVPVFRVLILSLIPLAMIPVFAYTLVSQKLERFDLLANAIGCGLLMLIGLLFIPRYGAVAAASAQVIAAFGFLVVEYFAVKRLLPLFIFGEVGLPAVGVVIMSSIIYAFRDLTLLITIPIGVLSYLVFLWTTRVLADLNRFVQDLRRMRVAREAK